MPKMKTNKAAKKRFKKTGSGKLVRGRRNLNHLLEKKSTSRKRRLKGQHDVSPADAKNVSEMLSS